MKEFTFTSSGHKYEAHINFEEALELMINSHRFATSTLRKLLNGTTIKIKVPNGTLTAFKVPVKNPPEAT